MIHILSNLTKHYGMQVLRCKDHIGLTTNRLKTDDLRGEWSLYYERMNIKDNSSDYDDDGDGEEIYLFGSRQSKGHCNSCGNQDHKVTDCC
jgi:hypothetical protein